MADALYGSVVALLNFVSNETFDRSPLAGTYTPTNGASLVSVPPNVMRLDGVNDYVRGPSGSQFAFAGEFCIEIVASKSAAGSSNYDTALTTDTSNGSAISGWTVELGTTRGFTFVANKGALILRAATTINDSTRHHWCVRRGADGVVRLDKDGTQIASVTSTAAIVSTGPIGVGRNNALTAYPFAGDVYAVRVTTASRYSGTSYTPDTAPFDFGSAYELSGIVTGSDGMRAERAVRAYREDTGALVGAVLSDSGTGAYSIITWHDGEHTVLAYPVSGEDLPVLALSRVIPI